MLIFFLERESYSLSDVFVSICRGGGVSSCGVIIWYAFIIISCSLSLCDVHLALVYVHLAFCDELSSLCNHNLSLLHAYMIRIYHYGMCFFNHVMLFRLYIMSCWTSICNMVSLYSICFFFWRFANSCFRLTQNVMWKNEGITCFVITYWWHQQKCIGNSTLKKKSPLWI